MVVSVALAVALLGASVFLAARPVSRRELARFASDHLLVVDAGNGPMVLRHLARSRSARWTGAICGCVVAVYAGAAGSTGRWYDNLTVMGPIGYFLGAVSAAAVGHAEAPQDGARAATLVPRRPRDYLGRILRWGPGATAAVLAAITVITWPSTPGRQGRVLADAVVSALAAAIWWAERRIVDRPQPMTDPRLLAADDAIRADLMHVIGGAGLALCAFIACGQLAAIAVSSTSTHGRSVANATAVIAAGLGLVGWLARRSPWFVRRSVPAAAAATASAATGSPAD